MNALLENLLLSLSMDARLDSGQKDLAEQQLLHCCLTGLRTNRASIWLYDSNKNAIHCQQILSCDGALAEQLPALTRQQYPNYFAELDKKRVINAENARVDQATSEFTAVYLVPQNIWSMLDVPLRYQGEVIGIICCEHTAAPRRWTDEDARFVGALSDLYGRIMAASERRRYQQELEHANERLEALVLERTEHLQQTLDKLKQTQQHLIESEKMASLGSLVAGIAHEVNTPVGIALTGITHFSHVLHRTEQSIVSGTLAKTQLQQTLAELKNAAELVERNLIRAAELISQFKQSAVDQSHYELHRFAIDDYILAVVNTLLPFCKHHQVQVELNLRSGVTLSSYPGAIAQVLTNLITNACIHAFDENAEDKIPLIVIESEMLMTGRVQIRVTDNGCGIPKEAQQRIFEPFFTTRRGRGGTGLGLSIAYNIVQKHLRGDLSVASKPGIGTRFSLRVVDLTNAKAAE